jgi:cyclophilin family peptidyl-prolyl cis-trans isomerase
MGTEKRERQKAQRAARLAAEAAAETRKRRMRTIRNLVIIAVIAVVILVAISGCSSSSSGSGEVSSKGDRSVCPPASGADKPQVDFPSAPPTCTKKGKTYTAVVDTTEGKVTVKLDPKKAPKIVNNFVFLSRWGFFDDTALFRTEAQSGIIQGGSPHTQDNTDPGPGYELPDEGTPFPASAYGPGALVMANHGPDTNGGEIFFIANDGAHYLGDASQTGPSAGGYVVFGQATDGLDVLQKIAALDDGSGAPGKPVKINSITIKES